VEGNPPAAAEPVAADVPDVEHAPTSESAEPANVTAQEQTGDPDLDKLLADFEAETQQQQQPAVDWEGAYRGAEWQAKQSWQHAQQVEQQAALERERRDARDLLRDVKGDMPLADEAVGYFLDGALLKHPELAQVWRNRHDDPQEFQRAKVRLG